MRIGGRTACYAVLGHPVAHTLSPAMHNAALRALGWDAVYLAFDVEPDRLPAALDGMHALGFRGINLTVPLKEVAFETLDALDPGARLVGSVNTVAFVRGQAVGYSTDGEGFLRARAEAFGGGIEGARVFVLGTGGAGRALALICAVKGAAALTLADADGRRARSVAEEIRTASPNADVRIAEEEEERVARAQASDLVIQATPVGMKPGDASPLPPKAFRKGQQAFDLIYGMPETPFMKAAAEGGARTANGLDMLLYQGVRSFEIWTGETPPVDPMRAALRQAVYG